MYASKVLAVDANVRSLSSFDHEKFGALNQEEKI